VSQGTVDTVAKPDTVRVRPGDIVAVPTDVITSDTSAGAAHAAHVDLPVKLYTVDATGTQLLTLAIRVAAEGSGLTFDAANKTFAGNVLIGLEDSLRPTQQIGLGRDMVLQVTSDAGEVVPPRVRIGHTNVPWQPVRVVARTPGDTVHILIQAVFNPSGYAAPIRVDRPRIDVRPASPNLQGLGLEATRVSVTIPTFLRTDTVTVTLWSDRGGLDAGTLRIPPTGTGEIGLRSSGLGLNTVHAEITGIATGQASMRYTLPWAFVVAALLGGVLGTVLRRRRRHLALADFVAGIVAGVVSAVAYAIGLNLTGVDLSVRVGEATVLVVAVLGATLDLPGLAVIRKRFEVPQH